MVQTSEYKKLISSYLKEIIDNDIVLIGVPKHMNLGDTLIWEAELDLFDTIEKKPKHTYFFYTNPQEMEVGLNDIIVWNGGGYFGDVWNFMSYSIGIFETFKNNKMVFMPNSVWFNDESNATLIRERLATHKNKVYLIVRDKQSLDIANRLFSDLVNVAISLLPDVVLSWDVKSYMEKRGLINTEGIGTLYINRADKEKRETNLDIQYEKKTDWPTIKLWPRYAERSYTCEEWEKRVKDRLLDDAINFILPYKKVISERMHGSILALLLDKETVLLNNSYGKSMALYNTWLKDKTDNIKCY